ncbi:cytochrome P450 [Mycena sp. CBHHK59/15]|nr:cytochrome P450 [Mycena sp. CBHHK59/15]
MAMAGAPQAEMSNLALVGVATVAFLVFQALRKSLTHSKLDAIPSVGIPGLLSGGFYVGAYNYIKNGREITQEGFAKYPGKAFKVALANRWLVIINGRSMIDEVRKAVDDQLSVAEATNSVLHLEYTLGYEQHHDPFQVAVIRTTLTRNIAVCFPSVRSEVIAAFGDLIPAKSDEWTSVPAMETILQIVSRTSNRLFVGLPKCRDPEYIAITTKFALDVVRDATVLHLVPAVLRPLATWMFGSLETATRNTIKHLGPILQHRIDMDDQYGRDWPNSDRPNDVISWLLDEARGHPKRRTVRTLTRTILNLNFGAIHTTTQGFLHVLYNLAAYPQYAAPLREEIEAVVKVEGWTKAAMGKMVKLDSFLKETFRLIPGGAVGVIRAVLKDFTLSDGTTIPAGTLLGIPVLAEQHDEANYSNPDEFDPFRFSRMREEVGEGTKHQMITPSPDFLVFGIGRHACPGRFFAVNEMKMILAHVLMTYDVKFENGMRPEDEWTALVMSANTTAEVMFRKRA